MRTFEIHYEVTIEGSVEVEAESLEKAIDVVDPGSFDISDSCEAAERDRRIVAVTWKEWGEREYEKRYTQAWGKREGGVCNDCGEDCGILLCSNCGVELPTEKAEVK